MKTRWILVFCLIVTAPLLRAQSSGAQENIPPPQPPLVAPVPDRAQWTVTLTYEGDDAAQTAKNPTAKPKHRLHQIVSTKTQDLKRAVEIYEDGTRDEYWFVGGLILLPEVNGVAVADFDRVNRPIYGEAGNPTESPGFAGVGWLQLKYYDKVAAMQNVPCYHYSLKGADISGIEAWINARTGFPVTYRVGGITYDYALGSAPESDLVLPPQDAQALKSYRQIENRRKQLEKDLGR